MLPKYMNMDRCPKMSMTERQIRKEFFHMNEHFRNAQPLGEAHHDWDEFYRQIQSYGVQLNLSVLVSIIQDDPTVFSGYLIRQDRISCDFDIDYEDQESSTWNEYEPFEPNFKPPQHTKIRSWDSNILAAELFEMLESGQIRTNFNYLTDLKTCLKRLK